MDTELLYRVLNNQTTEADILALSDHFKEYLTTPAGRDDRLRLRYRAIYNMAVYIRKVRPSATDKQLAFSIAEYALDPTLPELYEHPTLLHHIHDYLDCTDQLSIDRLYRIVRTIP